MKKTFSKVFFFKLLTYFLGSLLMGVGIIMFYYWEAALIGTALLLIIAAYFTSEELKEEAIKEYQNIIYQKNIEIEKINEEKNKTSKELAILKETIKEKNSGFTTLLQAIEEYEKLRDDKVSQYLTDKSHPAYKASEIVKLETKKRREADFYYKKTKSIIDYYESIAPFLADLKEDIVDSSDEKEYMFQDYSEEEQEDKATEYLTKEEFRKLPTVKRNQMALDRFWKRPKSKWLIGRLYERYVGYLYEKDGYNVDYVGIFKGYEDLGRDLICQKKNEFIVIQCKNWSKFSTIYEKHIFQFFGTVFQYKDENPDKKVKAVFYCTTKLSELAKRFAGELKIDLRENHKFDQTYPCIKCNISRKDKTKIYHLPFDQQYDKVKIEPENGEFYCKTIKEAEDAGFRRAFRYKGYKKK